MKNDVSLRLLPLASLRGADVPDNGGDVAELARSIRALGVLQPVLVGPPLDGGHDLIVGRRRALAARLAGLAHIPALVLREAPRDAALLRAAENAVRHRPTPAEAVASVAALAEGRDEAEVARALGLPGAQVANFVRLRRALHDEAWASFRREGHAASLRAWLSLGALPADEQPRALAKAKRAPPATSPRRAAGPGAAPGERERVAKCGRRRARPA